MGDTHLEIAILGWTPRVPGSWPIHSWSPWRSSLTDLSLLKPRSEISWPIPDTLQPTSETTWLLRVDLSNPTIARDSLVQSTKHRKKTCFQKASSVTFPQVSSVSTFRLLNYKYEMHLNCPTPRFDCPRKKPKLPSSSPGPPDSRAFSWRSQIIGQIIGIHWRKYPSKYGIFMGFWWDFDGILMGFFYDILDLHLTPLAIADGWNHSPWWFLAWLYLPFATYDVKTQILGLLKSEILTHSIQ